MCCAAGVERENGGYRMNRTYKQDHETQLLSEFEKQLKLLNEAEEIVLYGNSVVLPIISQALDSFQISANRYVFDKGVFINSTARIEKNPDIIILCGMRAKTRESMINSSQYFFPDVPYIDFFSIYFAWITQVVNRNCDHRILANTIIAARQEETIRNIDSINTSYCNLNCQECSNGMQYRVNRGPVAIKDHIHYINKITDVIPISYCNLQGGESLTDPNFDEVIRKHANNPRIALITVATNGTVIPSKEVMNAMKQTGAMFRVSDYGELLCCKDEVIDISKKNNVPCMLYPRAEEWFAYGKFTKHGRSDDENRIISEKCFFGINDIMLYRNRLCCCCRTLFADAINQGNLAQQNNSLDLDTAFSVNDLLEIIDGVNLHQMCDYCDYPMAKIKPALQQGIDK